MSRTIKVTIDKIKVQNISNNPTYTPVNGELLLHNVENELYYGKEGVKTLIGHIHDNKVVLDNIIDTGDGLSFLANDGTYKTVAQDITGQDLSLADNSVSAFITLGDVPAIDLTTELHLDQTTPQTFTAGSVTGSGLLKVTAGQLGLDTTTYVSGTPWTSEGYYVGDGSAFDPIGSAAAITPTTLGLVIGTDILAYRTFGSAANNNTGDFQAPLTFGIANTNAVKIDFASVADNDYAKFTANGLEGRNYAEVLSDIGALGTSHANTHPAPTIRDSRNQVAGTYNTIIGTDSDINTSGSTIIDSITVTDGVITAMGTRVLTLTDLGYSDPNTWRGIDDTPVNGQTAESISSNWAYNHAIVHADNDADNTAANQTSHVDVVQDGDFSSNGIMVRTALGIYGIITDSSTNWDTAYTHSQVAHAPSDADNTAANETSHAGLITISSVTFETLNANADVGNGSTQVAQGNHTHLYLPLSGGTLTGDLVVPDEAYGVGWNTSLEVPTKNAVYDKINSLPSADPVTYEQLVTAGDVGTGAGQLAIGNHTHSGVYEPVITTKNTAFNKDYGTIAGTVCQGNDSRLSDTRTPSNNTVDDNKLTTKFKGTSALTGTVVDWDLELTRTKTLTGNTTLTFTNLYEGVKFIKTTGDYSITFPTGFTWVGGERSATGTTWYQVVCENASTPTGIYSILKAES